MFKLPDSSALGKLDLCKVLEYYDFPRTFTCKSTTGQQYIAISTFDDDEEYHWLYLALSRVRHDALLLGQLPLRSAFRNPESGYVFAVKTYQARPSVVELLLPEQVSDDDLPSPTYVLNALLDADTTHVVAAPREVALATRRETFDYRIFPGDSSKHEIAARKFGAILTSTQELIDSLGQACEGQPTVRGPISGELLNRTRINVAYTFAGSFGVQLRANSFSDLLADSLLSDAITELGNLFSAADSEDHLSNKLHALKGRVASKYRRLLKELTDLDSGLVMDWGAVRQDRGGRFELSREEVKRAYEIVDRIDIALAEEVVVEGQLIGFNSRTQKYEIRSTHDPKTFSGKVATDAKIHVQNPAINEFYVAKLRMLVETQSTSGDELIRWVLVELSERT